MSISKTSIVDSKKVKKTLNIKINENPFTLEDVQIILKERQELIDIKSQQKELEKKQKILSKISDTDTKNTKVFAASLADILGFDPGKTKEIAFNTKPIDDIPLQFKKYYKLLLQLREKCKTGVYKFANVNIKGASSAQESENSSMYNKHDCDVNDFDSDFALSLLKNEQEALLEIEAAIKRIYDGSYGICEVTGKQIETARLLAVPFTRFSIEGKQAQEKTVKTRERNGGSIFASEISDDDSTIDYSSEYDD